MKTRYGLIFHFSGLGPISFVVNNIFDMNAIHVFKLSIWYYPSHDQFFIFKLRANFVSFVGKIKRVLDFYLKVGERVLNLV